MSTSLKRQIERKNRMNNKVTMRVPAIGGNPSQPAFDIREAVQQACICGNNMFDKQYRIGFISEIAAGNRTGQKINVEYPTYVCLGCGLELEHGKQMKIKQ
uniref:Uncharacterized protein n=1 Tax=viral metagenome TaxID=1070528 RepID=A0A6H1ZCW9_9ZZZZ